MAGRVPRLGCRGAGRALHRRRRHRLRGPVPRRHRRDGRPRPEDRGRRDRRAGREGPHVHAADRGRDLGRRRDAAAVRPRLLAVLPDRHRREPVRASPGPADDRPLQGGRARLELPRQRRRDLRHARGRTRGLEAGQRRAGVRPRDHDPGRPLQRPRGAGGGARRRRRRVLPVRAGAHEHRHRAAGPGLPPGRARPVHEVRHPARDRRDAHDLRRPGRVHEALRPASRTCSRSARPWAPACRAPRTA